MKEIALLGATGSIGESTLAVLDQHPGKFRLQAVAAHSNWKKLREIIQRYEVEHVCLWEEEAAVQLQKHTDIQISHGMDGLLELVSLPAVQVVVNGLVGSVGCLPTLRALENNKIVALANKETMVMGGEAVKQCLQKFPLSGIVPVDSEHNAIFQCLAGRPLSEVENIQLTASGGPFREWGAERFAGIKVKDALNHPIWSMGRKITIDSATLMNKGLEVIEAHYLFGLGYENIQVVVHPQSVIHSMVQFRDGNLMAQLGSPDMKIPIQCALTWPERLSLRTGRVSLPELGGLSFFPPDFKRFPCLRLAYESGRAGGIAPATLNAANEVLVAAFLEEKIGFLQIPAGIEWCLERVSMPCGPIDLNQVLEADALSRQLAIEYIGNHGKV